MRFILQPWQLFVLILASWINREQQQRLDYLATEVAVLKEFMLRIDAGERRISCPKASPPGHSQLASVGQTDAPNITSELRRVTSTDAGSSGSPAAEGGAQTVLSELLGSPLPSNSPSKAIATD